jgi:hypothetical protein
MTRTPSGAVRRGSCPLAFRVGLQQNHHDGQTHTSLSSKSNRSRLDPAHGGVKWVCSNLFRKEPSSGSLLCYSRPHESRVSAHPSGLAAGRPRLKRPANCAGAGLASAVGTAAALGVFTPGRSRSERQAEGRSSSRKFNAPARASVADSFSHTGPARRRARGRSRASGL